MISTEGSVPLSLLSSGSRANLIMPLTPGYVVVALMIACFFSTQTVEPYDAGRVNIILW